MPAPSASPTAHDRYTTVNGLRFRYREAGDPAAPPVVVLHGMMGVGREWDTLTAALARHFHVVTLDQRGHGGTDWASDYRLNHLADDVVGIIERLGLPNPALVGHSMGGMAAMVCAAERSDLAARLVLVDIGPDSVTGEWALTGLVPLLETLAAATYLDPADAVEEWLAANSLARRPLIEHFVEHSLVARADGRLVWRFDAAGLTGFVTDPGLADRLWNAVDAIAAPTLVVRGEHSPLLPARMATEMVRRLADGRLVEISAGGHDLGVEQPEAVTAAVSAFLLEPPSPPDPPAPRPEAVSTRPAG